MLVHAQAVDVAAWLAEPADVSAWRDDEVGYAVAAVALSEYVAEHPAYLPALLVSAWGGGYRAGMRDA